MNKPAYLQINTHDTGGGAERVAWNLFSAYRARGYDSWFAVGHKHLNDPDIFEIPNPLEDNPWARGCRALTKLLEPLDGLHIGAGRLRAFLREIANPRLAAENRAGREPFCFPGTRQVLDLPPRVPDIVHAHNLHGGYFDLGALPWLSRQAPLILTLHDAWLFTGHCAYPCDCAKWKYHCGACPDLEAYQPIKQDASRLNLRRKRDIYSRMRCYVAAPSEWLLNLAKTSVLAPAARQMKMIPNGIDLSVFAPGDRSRARRNLKLPDDAQIILLSAQHQYKNFDVMEQALSRLTQGDRELLFICLGRDAPEKRAGNGRMIFPGMLRDVRVVAEYYRAADIFLHAAHAEAFGKTITEAMACGTPVVATATGGIVEQIEDGRNGLLRPAEASHLTAAMQMMLDDNSFRAAIADTGMRSARARYGLDRQVDAYLDWYGDVLEDWRCHIGEKTERLNA